MSNSWIGKAARQAIYDRDDLTCCYCGVKCITNIPNASILDMASRKLIASLDHIVPQFRLAQQCNSDQEFFAARKNPINLVVVCVGCNSSKQHIDLKTWCKTTRKDYASILLEIERRVNKGI